jgi:hypothetical protein
MPAYLRKQSSLFPLANSQQGYGYQYIYVEQLPTYGLPDIALDSSVFEPGALPTLQIPIRLLDVYPLDNWNEPTFTLKPTMTLQNTVLGAFRYALVHHNGKLGDSVDIFVGLAPGYEGPRLLWCAQQQTDSNPTGTGPSQSLQQTLTAPRSRRRCELYPKISIPCFMFLPRFKPSG